MNTLFQSYINMPPRLERPLPKNYCYKCELKMYQASKHKFVCPKCRAIKKI